MFTFFSTEDPNAVLSPRRIRVLIILGVLLAVGAISARPAYRAAKGWRARSFAAQALAFLEDKDLAEAAHKAQAALSLSPSEPAALRAMAQIQAKAARPFALQYWQRLMELGAATDEDRRDYVEAALRMGFISAAYEELRKLTLREPNAPPNLWLLSQVCIAWGDVPGAIDFSMAAQKQQPDNQQYQLFPASLQFDAPDPSKRDSARAKVWEMAAAKTPLAQEAQRFLAKRTDLSRDDLTRLINLIQEHPRYRTPEKLVALDLTIRLQPEREAELLNSAIQQYQGGLPEDLKLFAGWLNASKHFEATLRALPEASALERQDLFILHLDALAALGRWNDTERVLRNNNNPLPETIISAFRARCETKLNNPEAAAGLWKRVLEVGEKESDHLWFVAQYAEKAGDPAQAEKIYRLLASSSANPRPAYQALVKLAETGGDTSQLCSLLGEMAKRWPADRALRNDHAYLSLLLGRNLSISQKTAEELVQEFPDNLPHRITLALAYYRQNKFPEALKVCTSRQYNWQMALPSNRAIFAAVLAANGHLPQADEITRGLFVTQLRKEERELLPGSG